MEKRLISVDELRAAGALDVPAAWRKSLGNAEDNSQQPTLPGFGDEPTDQSDVEPVSAAGGACAGVRLGIRDCKGEDQRQTAVVTHQ